MGHYLSELYPRGMEVERRERQEREAEIRAKELERHLSRLKREDELLEISGVELSQAELKQRISKMLRRYDRISSTIPAPITLHLKDGKDSWEMSGFLNKTGAGSLYFVRDDNRENEYFELSIKGRGKEVKAVHRERG